MRRVSIDDLRSAMAEGAPVIDVREPEEFASGHVPGARLVPLATVPEAMPELTKLAELGGGKPVYVICQVGARSQQAAAYLSQHGVDACSVDGGTGDWMAAGLPVER